MILLDEQLHEIGEIALDIDAEFGSSEEATNDFEFVFSMQAERGIYPNAFYIPGTEIGGLIDFAKTKSSSDNLVYRGYTWRGLMSKAIIMPPQGADYMTVSGEANSIMASMLSGVLGDVFTVSSEDSGLTITSYQFPLYINMLDGLEGMLEAYGYRLKITAQKVASAQPIQILVEAVAATIVSGVYNEDNGVPMIYQMDNMGINHLICGGAGELQARQIIDLYLDNMGNISRTQFYFGIEERTAFFDYPNAESEDDLIDSAIEEFKTLATFKSMAIKAPENQELEIGDIVRGVFPDGSSLQSPVVRKIYKIEHGLLTTECKIKGEE